MGSATPPIDFFVGAWLGLVLLAFALATPSRFRRTDGALRGWVFGTAVNAVALRFVPYTIARFTDLPRPVGWLALLLLAMFEGLPWAFAGWATRRLADRRVPGFLAFGLAAWASTFVPTVFPWTVAGGLSPLHPLVQIAELIGERGVTALVAMSAALAAQAFIAARTKQRREALLAAGVSLAVPLSLTGYGIVRIRTIDRLRTSAHSAAIALVQPSTEAKERWDPNEAAAIVQRLTTLTRNAEQRGADLVVWPEAAFPYTMQATARADLVGPFAVLQPGIRGPVLTGLVMHTHEGAYNSATIVHAGHVEPPYHKMHLLAFGEAVPLAGVFPVLRRTFARGLGMIPGEHQVVLTSGPIRAAVLNCFEDTLPEAGREAAEVDPNLLVNVTNDAWFVGTQESELHLRLATMRAIELRRDLVRAVNLGPTSWVDATGRVRARFEPAFPGSLQTRPALLEGSTFYARFGDLGAAGILALLSFAAWFGRRLKEERRAA